MQFSYFDLIVICIYFSFINVCISPMYAYHGKYVIDSSQKSGYNSDNPA